MARVNCLDRHFKIVEAAFKEQFGVENFDEFALPTESNQLIIGRVINLNTEDSKLSQSSVSLINTSEYNTQSVTIKVNLGEIPNFSLFEGEIVVVEGINSHAAVAINANRIHKLKVKSPVSFLNPLQIRSVNADLFKTKSLQLMIACGPFSLKNSLSYQGLKDFLEAVKKDEPNGVILMGPFLDQNNEDISMGELFYERGGEEDCASHEELFKDLMNFIGKELQGIKTEVMIIPSMKEITHFSPYP